MKKKKRASIGSSYDGLTAAQARAMLAGLPKAPGYRIEVKPLHYRRSPHLSAECDWGHKRITLQVPAPFRPFAEAVAYRAKRIRASRGKLSFQWFVRRVRFRTPREVVRFLYCHEWFHYYLREVLRKTGQAETACDRYALQNFRRRRALIPR